MPSFTVEGLAGEGAAGKVYRASAGGRPVALKFPKLLGDADVRFLKEEVKVLSRMSHQGLVSLQGFYERYDASALFGPSAGRIDAELLGRPFLAMDWLDGTPLDRAGEAGFPKILDWAVQMLQGLHYLHARGVLHRDLKPSNAVAGADGRVRLLDFGLALPSGEAGEAAGTPSAMAPEAFRGEAEERSDLFSLGCVLYRLLAGRDPFPHPATPASLSRLEAPVAPSALRKDVPDYFSSFVLWLLSFSPSDRPSSARTALAYLRSHAPQAFGDAPDEPGILEKPPLVGREAELRLFDAALERLRNARRPAALAVTGPAGSGRSRLIEEFRWKTLLAGIDFRFWGAADADAGVSGAGDGGADEAPEVICFADAHLWSEEEMTNARLFWALASSSRRPRLLIAEYDGTASPNLFPEALAAERIVLGDFDEDTARVFLDRAAAGARLKPREAGAILHRAGGRPLLLLEGLREALFGAPSPGRKRLAAKWSDAALSLLAALAAHPQTAAAEGARAASGLSDDAFAGALAELDRTGVTAPRTADKPGLRLRHPALADSYRALCGDERLRRAHRAWLAAAEDAATRIHHALALGDAEVMVTDGLPSVDVFVARGDLAKAHEVVEKLKDYAPRLNRVWLHSHRAAIDYRLGRFDDALKAYDDWLAAKDESDPGAAVLSRLRHHYARGLVFLAAGRGPEAEAELRAALALGDLKNADHRHRLARVHLALGSLLKDRRGLDGAGGHFRAARELTDGDEALAGEADLRSGEIAHAQGRFDEAAALYASSLKRYEKLANPQLLSIAWNAQALLDKDRGLLDGAVRAARKAEEAARASGDRLQWTRCRGNLGLVLMEAARYGEAAEWIESAEKMAAVLGNDADRLIVTLHHAEWFRWTGLETRFRETLNRLEKEKGALNRSGLGAFFRVLKAEALADAGRLTEAMAFLEGDDSPSALAHLRRWNLLLGKKAETPAGAPAPAGSQESYWDETARFLSDPGAGAAEYRALAEKIAACPWPENALELERALSVQLQNRGLARLAKLHADNAGRIWRDIRDRLPEEMKMDFDKNRGLKDLDASIPEKPVPAPPAGAAISEQRFRQFCEINRQIAQKSELSDILERVLDAALELTGAERGFLVLRDAASKSGPLKGYEIRASRHINQKSIPAEELQISMTVLKEAIDRGAPLLTDNAQHDPRLKTRASVMQYKLSSILAVPFSADGESVGALYLDHRGRPDCFQQEHVTLLSGFASQAALAIQKARMISELKARNQNLEIKVKDLSQELKASRDGLKNDYKDIIGKSRPMVQVLQLIDRVAPTKIPVWIHGASGTGKELVARALHAGSPRKNGPFVAENCGAIAENLLESELFGHKKGAFTHAERDRTGLFEQASGGTLFLDEVADMPAPMQVKLLRALQEGEIRPLGANKTVKVDVRLVTASNLDLARLVKAGKFRQDLFFRINGMTIPLPPLKDRKDDIPLLVKHFTRKIAQDFDLKESPITKEALKKLMDHDWPGNIRELEAAVRNMLLFAQGEPVTADMIPLQPGAETPEPAAETEAPRGSGAEHDQMVALLKKHRLDKKKVADELAVTLKTVYMRLGALGIPKKTSLLRRYLDHA